MEVLMGSSLDEGGEGKLRFFKKKRGGDYRNNDNNMNISNDNDNDNDNMNDIDLNNNNKNNIQKGKEGGERRRRRGGGGRGGGERLLIPVLYVKVILLSRGEDKVGEGGGAMRLDPASWTFFIKVDGDNSDFVQVILLFCVWLLLVGFCCFFGLFLVFCWILICILIVYLLLFI